LQTEFPQRDPEAKPHEEVESYGTKSANDSGSERHRRSDQKSPPAPSES
jgi:hypothetical protein